MMRAYTANYDVTVVESNRMICVEWHRARDLAHSVPRWRTGLCRGGAFRPHWPHICRRSSRNSKSPSKNSSNSRRRLCANDAFASELFKTLPRSQNSCHSL